MAVVAPPRESAEPGGTPRAPTAAETEARIRGYRPDGRLMHIPALDGFRGLGIPFVLLYHNGSELFGINFGGGLLTVSMFFTLSGFLITRLLVHELDRSGTIKVGSFYGRRFRRLMPAALVVLALIALFWAVFPAPGRNMSFGSYLSSLFYVQNQYLRFQGHSYSNLFLERSPLQHMWSLSLEEQIYFVFPLTVVAVAMYHRTRKHLAGVLLIGALVSFAIGGILANRGGNVNAYYATEARAGEFLLGAAAAVYWLKGRSVPKLAALIQTPVGRAASFAVLAGEVVLWWHIRLSTSWMFPWGVGLDAFLTCVILYYGVLRVGCSGFLSIKPLAATGTIVYGLYLVHWPVFLFIGPDQIHVSAELLFAIRVAVTVVITLVIFHFVEDPVRSGRKWKGRRFAEACVLLALVGVVIAPFAQQPGAAALVDESAVALQQNALASLPDLPPDAPTHSAIDPALPARVLVVGDSQSWIVGNGMKDYWAPGAGVTVEPSPGVGCGTTAITPIRYLGEDLPQGQPGCREWREALPQILAKFRPQLVTIVGSVADVSDHQIDGRWQHIGEPAFDAWLSGEMQRFVDELKVGGAHVLWMTLPDVKIGKPPGTSAYPEEDPARVTRYNELIAQLAAADDSVDTADLRGFLQARPGGEFDTTLRPDGAHFDMKAAPDLVAWFGDQIRSVSAGH